MPDAPAINLRLYDSGVRWPLMTYRDAIEHGMRFLGGAGTQQAAQQEIRQAVLSAYDELSLIRRWNYYQKHGRVHLQSNQTTGTVTYDHTGGASCERELTLASATWPSNVTRGCVVVGSGTSAAICRVQRKISSTVVQLDPTLNPGADVAAGTTYEWFRSSYLLPPDFLSLHDVENQNRWWQSHYVPFSTAVALNRYSFSTGNTWTFSITGQAGAFGAMEMVIWSSPGTIDATNRTVDFAYVGMPFPITISGFEKSDCAGTVALTAAGSTVTGTGTDWWADQAGAVLRVSRNVSLPTDRGGLNLMQFQGIVREVTATDSITLADANDGDVSTPSTTVSGKGFVISDPIDVAPYMQTALRRGIEWQLSQIRNMKVRGECERAYINAWRHAAHKDGTLTTTRRWSGEGSTGYAWGGRMGRDGEVGSEQNGG